MVAKVLAFIEKDDEERALRTASFNRETLPKELINKMTVTELAIQLDCERKLSNTDLELLTNRLMADTPESDALITSTFAINSQRTQWLRYSEMGDRSMRWIRWKCALERQPATMDLFNGWKEEISKQIRCWNKTMGAIDEKVRYWRERDEAERSAYRVKDSADKLAEFIMEIARNTNRMGTIEDEVIEKSRPLAKHYDPCWKLVGLEIEKLGTAYVAEVADAVSKQIAAKQLTERAMPAGGQ